MAPRALAPALFIALVAIEARAHAQDLPQGTVAPAPVSKGTTEINSQKFEAAAKVPDPEKEKDATELTIGAGGLAASGNARLVSLTTNGDFRTRWSDNQVTAAVAGNYGRTAVPGASLETNVANLQARSRYDRFFLTDWTAFLGLQARNDRFQGIDLRLQVDPGIGYYFVNEPTQLLWVELGYDYLHDVRRDEDRVVRDAAGLPTGVIIDKTSSVHSGRAFLGYNNQLNEAVTFNAGVEYLQGLSDTMVHRLNGDAKLSSKIGAGFSLATSFSIRYDNQPLPRKEKVDTITALNLVFKLL
jgi:putative salt-induced outer membrane protein YdiY